MHHTHLRKALLVDSACLLMLAVCPAALTTSFTDDFNRDSLGTDYAVIRGAAYGISARSILTNGGPGQNHMYLKKDGALLSLPTVDDYADGYGFSASIDLFIPACGQASIVTAGLVLNEQDGKGGGNNRLLRFRGEGVDCCSIQLLGGNACLQSANMGRLGSDTWYTLSVSSPGPGVYRYAFRQRGCNRPITRGTFTEKGSEILAGGHIGIYTENAAAGAYQFDNFSVEVKAVERPHARELLLFSDTQDVTNVWGKIHFGTTPLERVATCAYPGFELSYCQPRSDGAWDVHGLTFEAGPPVKNQVKEHNTWQVIRAETRDGKRFENRETVYESEPGPWTFNHAMAYNPEAKEFMLLKLKMDDSGFRYTAFFSPDGRAWAEHPRSPLFYDGDAISLFWSPQLRRMVCVSKSLQPVTGTKHIPDHGGKCRRVLSIRTSRDGRLWEPTESMEDVWNRGGRWKPMPDALLTVPDEIDPPDLEFYSGNAFWHHDRSYMMVLNYAASPLTAGKHAPQLDTEWWVGRDGLRWVRPGRGVNATGAEVTRLTHNPLIIGGMFLFHYGNRLLGMKQDRVSFVGARANAEFSTTPFTMPAGDLLLNAAVPSPERAFATQQAYIMVAVLDEHGTVVPGFGAEHCTITAEDQIDLPLVWDDRSARALAGRRICLRFYLRGASIYAVTFNE